ECENAAGPAETVAVSRSHANGISNLNLATGLPRCSTVAWEKSGLLYVVRDLEIMNHKSEAASSPDPTSGEQWIREAPASLKQTRWGLNLVVYGSALVFLAA
ncbi:MAG TPA: hypothetical protein DDZ90_19375, partial [Planctomycetaceae bacterium]|nr:hypothetical protein [Planctomycetaceae bacterium]